VPGDTKAATVDWSPASIMGTTVDRTIHQGLRSIRVGRPDKQMSLVGNYMGYSTERLVLEPYARPVPRPRLTVWQRVAGNQVTSIGNNVERTVCAHPPSGYKFVPHSARIEVTINTVDDGGENWNAADFPRGRPPSEQEVCVWTMARPSSGGQRATIEAWADIQQVEE
jgi:hypothetical protein